MGSNHRRLLGLEGAAAVRLGIRAGFDKQAAAGWAHKLQGDVAMFLDMSILMHAVEEARLIQKAEKAREEEARLALSPEKFFEWKEARRLEKVAERRHYEKCRSIEKAGRNANFWNVGGY